MKNAYAGLAIKNHKAKFVVVHAKFRYSNRHRNVPQALDTGSHT